jgi:hypothetical protein
MGQSFKIQWLEVQSKEGDRYREGFTLGNFHSGQVKHGVKVGVEKVGLDGMGSGMTSSSLGKVLIEDTWKWLQGL